MTYNNENAMMETKKDFILPAMVEDDCISVDVSEDYEGLRLSFPRVKIPGGGSLQFEIPSDDPENPDYTKPGDLEAVCVPGTRRKIRCDGPGRGQYCRAVADPQDRILRTGHFRQGDAL